MISSKNVFEIIIIIFIFIGIISFQLHNLYY